MNDEATCRLALSYISNIGGVTIKKLLQQYGSASAIFAEAKANSLLIKRGVRLVLTSEILRRVEEERLWMSKKNIRVCFYTDADFPKRLKNCSDSPYFFYYQGKNVFNEKRAVAVVGTRNISPYGKEVTRQVIETLQPYGVCIVSGLALGVDAVAHEQALTNDLPTVAVMGAGFRYIYPSENRALAERILERGGALVTEYPYSTKPDRQHFPQRNRIIAGMTDATIVMETAVKGGSVITAYIANSYNRDVFAVPGSIFSVTSDGCNQLIRKNVAAVITSGNDVAEMMGWDVPKPDAIQRSLFVELTEDEQRVFDIIEQKQEIAIDDIIMAIPGFSPSKMAAVLLQLELKGVVQCNPGKSYRVL